MGCISFTNTCPSSGDTEQQLLSKILQVINTTGGGIAGVSSISINGGAPQTGAVSITTGGTVTSVNGDPGPAVSLDSGEIPEGANLYFTTARVRATDLTGFASALGAITAADTILSAFGKTQGRLAALEAGTAGPFLLKAGDTGTGAFLFTPAAVDVIPLTLTSAVGSATTSSLFVANGGATNRLTIRNDGRFILAGRILATNTDVLGNTLNFSDAGTNNSPIGLAIGHTSTAGLGTAAAGFGVMLDFNLDSTTTLATRAVQQTASWTDPTHATRTAALTFLAFTSGSETIQLTLNNNQIQGGDGTVALPTFSDRNDTNTGLYFPAADTLGWTLGGTEASRLTTTSFTSASSLALGATSVAPDVFLSRDAANTLAHRNGATTQLVRIYHTFTDASNYSRLTLSHNAAATGKQTVNFLAETGGTGDDNISVRIAPAGTGGLYLGPVADGTAVGGNARGDQSTDFQLARTVNTHVASGTNSTIVGGSGNTASGFAGCAIGGFGNIASGNYSAAINLSNTASGENSFAHGFQSIANKWGQAAQASGRFSANGDAQASVLLARAITTDATANVELFLDGATATQRCTIATDTAWCFSILLVARRTDADNECAMYKFEGGLDNNAGTTALVGTVTKTVLAEDTAAWDADVVADNTNDSLKIQVTGEAAKTIRWVARITLAEVTG